jgi:hypothetical protein
MGEMGGGAQSAPEVGGAQTTPEAPAGGETGGEAGGGAGEFEF